jgi:outer membrane lipoprotein-sorting protein
MRKSLFAAVAAVAFLAAGLPASAQPTVDQLIEKNIKARGGEARLRQLNSMRLSGKVTAQGMELPMVILAKRPNMMRQEVQVQDKKVVTAFDGATAWMVNPLMGTETPQEIQGPQAEMTREQADFDPVLLDYKAKGHTIELVKGDGPGGTEKLADGRSVHHLKVTRKGGRVQHYYLDAESGMELKTATEIETPDGRTATIESEMSDYREAGGLMVPHTLRNLMNGTPMATMTIDQVEFNAEIDDGLFKKPGSVQR